MFNVTTKYDKIGDERKKVFMIRGEEAYARTVDIVLSGTQTSSINIKGFPVTFNVTLYRNLGDSQLVFYDDTEPIGTITTHDYTQNYTFNTRLSWGAYHKIWCQYKANKQTLGKKSKSISYHQSIPSEYVPTITFTSSTQVNNSTSYTATGTITFLGETVEDGTSVEISLDGVLKDTVFTTDGAFSCNVGTLNQGKHTITASTLQSESMNAKTQNFTVSTGYNVTILEYPKIAYTDQSYTYKVSVKTLNGAGVNNATVSFGGTTATTNSQGIATFTLTNLATGSYRASCNGSYSDYISIQTIAQPPIEISYPRPVVAWSYKLPIDIVVPNGAGLELNVSDNGVSKGQITLNNQGKYTYNYTGWDNGVRTLVFSKGSQSATANITSCLAYESSSWGKGNTGIVCRNGASYDNTNHQPWFHIGSNGQVEFKFYYGNGNANVMEFKVVVWAENGQSLEVYYGDKLMDTLSAQGVNPLWKSRNTVKFKYDDGTFYYYLDGELQYTKAIEDVPTSTNKYWKFKNGGSGTSISLKMDDFIVYTE